VVSETQPIPPFSLPYPGEFRTVTSPHVGVKDSRAIVVWDRGCAAIICRIPELKALADLYVVEGGDHSFKVLKPVGVT
jgi:hypothetical protein